MNLSLKAAHVLLIIVFVLGLLLMLWEIVLARTPAGIFYLITNAILIIRLAGVNIFTKIIHILSFAYLIAVLIYLRWEHSGKVAGFTILWLIVPLLLVFVISMHLMLFRPGLNYKQRALHATAHAVMGIQMVILAFWICCFTAIVSYAHAMLQSFYLLLFLFIELTPYFLTDTHAAAVAEQGPPPEKPCKRPKTQTKASP